MMVKKLFLAEDKSVGNGESKRKNKTRGASKVEFPLISEINFFIYLAQIFMPTKQYII